MAKLPVLPARDLLKALGKAGFAVVSQRGATSRMRQSRRGSAKSPWWTGAAPPHNRNEARSDPTQGSA